MRCKPRHPPRFTPLPSPAAFPAILIALGSLGCGCPGSERPPSLPPLDPLPVVALEPEAACPSWRWIGVKEDSARDLPCPYLEGWTRRHLFAPAAFPDDLDDPHHLPPGLRPFCLYEHEAGGGELSPAYLPGLRSLERDCMAVTPAGSELARQSLPALERHFLSQTGRVPLPPVAAAPPARLAVIDTAPNNDQDPETDPFNSPHGYTLIHMAKQLLCDAAAPGCVATVAARLALPWVSFDPLSRPASLRDEVRGGYVGLIGELAEAIRAEVVTQQNIATPPPLVLNLSVGWRPAFGGLETDVTTMRPAVQAVYRAMEDAFCRGALALAAAGNQSWGPTPDAGPLLPAAWEDRAAPDAAACTAATGVPGPAAAAAAYRPLIFAVGGVRADGERLFNARFRAEPLRVAFADHGAVGPFVPAPEPGVLTGTSVGTLVASAAAGAIRHYLPDLPPSAVMARLDRQGEDLGRAADFCLGGRQRDCSGRGRAVRRVALCPAVSEACGECQGPGCPAACPSGLCPPRQPLDLDTAALARTLGAAPRVDLATAPPARSSISCPPARVAFLGPPGGGRRERLHSSPDPRSTTFPCPRWQLFDVTAQAETGPQPGSNPCPSCTLDRDPGNLTLEIDDAYVGRLGSPTLQVGLDAFALGLDLAGGSAKALVTGVAADPGEPVVLSFVVDQERSVTSPVLVVP